MEESYSEQEVIGMLRAHRNYMIQLIQANVLPTYPTRYDKSLAQKLLPEALEEYERVVPEEMRKGVERLTKGGNSSNHIHPHRPSSRGSRGGMKN
jgi:hypothetical protein